MPCGCRPCSWAEKSNLRRARNVAVGPELQSPPIEAVFTSCPLERPQEPHTEREVLYHCRPSCSTPSLLGVEDHHKDGETLLALSQLKATDRRQDKPPRKQPEQKQNNLYAETGQHDALVGHQPSRPCLRDIRCRDVQDCMLKSGFNPRPCLKFRRHRTGTERRHAHSARSEFLAQRFAERQDVGLGGIIHRHPRARQKARKRTEIEDAATMPDQAVGKP